MGNRERMPGVYKVALGSFDPYGQKQNGGRARALFEMIYTLRVEAGTLRATLMAPCLSLPSEYSKEAAVNSTGLRYKDIDLASYHLRHRSRFDWANHI